MTYYDILGVPHDATLEQIKQAYRLQIRFFHPDIFDGSPTVADIKTKQLNEAYSVLGNPELRAQYDRTLKTHTQSSQKTPSDNEAHAYSRTTPPPRSADTGSTYNPVREAEEVRRKQDRQREAKSRKKLNRIILLEVAAIVVVFACINQVHQNRQREQAVISQSITENENTTLELKQSVVDNVPHLNEYVERQKEKEKPTPINKPVSGTILSGGSYSGSEITVTADSGYDYVVSLKNAKGTERLCFYVRAGETVTVGVPSEHLYVYFASGKEWHGYGKGRMFGEGTVYSKDDEMIDFTQYTLEYTLYPVTNGNFSKMPSDEEEFF